MTESAGDRARRSVPAVGPLLGRYRLAARPEQEGIPVAAWDTQDARAVGVAGLGRPLAPDERARLARARRVTHPALAAPLAEGQTVLGPVVVTELVTGRTLADVVDEDAPDARRVAALLTPVAAGLEALHDAGLAHGALALDQAWVGEDGHVVLWGAEVPRGDREGPPTAAQDVRALGRIAARCLRARDPDAPVPEGVTAALGADPADRPPRPSAVLAGMAEGPAPAPAVSPAGLPARRRLAVASALGLLVLVAIALLASLGTDGASPRRSARPEPVLRAGGIGLPAPPPWHRAPAREPGLRASLALARPGAALVAGRVAHPAPVTLLPPGLAAARRPRATALNGRVARRWVVAGGVAFLVPAVAGDPILLRCRAPRGALLAACERLADRAELPPSGPLDPDPRLAAALARVRHDLDGARRRASRHLAHELRLARRAATVRRLADAYARAAARLRTTPATPAARPVIRALARATARVARADRRLAATLTRPHLRGVADALRAVYAALGRSARPSGVLAALGYGRPTGAQVPL